MRRGGQGYATYYLINSDSQRRMEMGQGSLRFRYDHGEYWTVDEKARELSIAYDEGFIRQLYARFGLSLEKGVYYGGWCGRESRWGYPEGDQGDQDALVAKRT